MLLQNNTFLIKEQVEFLKLAGTYDIFDPDTQAQLGVAKEEPTTVVKLLKLVLDKRILPTKVTVYDANKQALFSINKPAALRSKVSIYKSTGEYLGLFKTKLFTMGGCFLVYDPMDRQVAEIKGDWKSWNFKFLDMSNREIGTVTKKWTGFAREVFTSADSYFISLTDQSNYSVETKILLLAAGLAIDIIYKER